MDSRAAPFQVTRASDEAGRFRRDEAGRFVNLDGTGPHPFRDVYKWAVSDKLAGRRRKSPPRAEVPAVVPDHGALQTPPAPGEGARLVWLGHASWLIQLCGLSFLIDPVLGDSIVGFTKRNGDAPLAAAQLPPITAQLVSHNHYDHMDMPSLRAVGAPVVLGLGNARSLGGHLPATELGWWDSLEVGGVRVTYVPSQHWSRRSLNDANRALWGGFVMEGDGLTIYVGSARPGGDAGHTILWWFMSRSTRPMCGRMLDSRGGA